MLVTSSVITSGRHTLLLEILSKWDRDVRSEPAAGMQKSRRATCAIVRQVVERLQSGQSYLEAEVWLKESEYVLPNEMSLSN